MTILASLGLLIVQKVTILGFPGFPGGSRASQDRPARPPRRAKSDKSDKSDGIWQESGLFLGRNSGFPGFLGFPTDNRPLLDHFCHFWTQNDHFYHLWDHFCSLLPDSGLPWARLLRESDDSGLPWARFPAKVTILGFPGPAFARLLRLPGLPGRLPARRPWDHPRARHRLRLSCLSRCCIGWCTRVVYPGGTRARLYYPALLLPCLPCLYYPALLLPCPVYPALYGRCVHGGGVQGWCTGPGPAPGAGLPDGPGKRVLGSPGKPGKPAEGGLKRESGPWEAREAWKPGIGSSGLEPALSHPEFLTRGLRPGCGKTARTGPGMPPGAQVS